MHINCNRKHQVTFLMRAWITFRVAALLNALWPLVPEEHVERSDPI
jgi:hypothetical protein